MKQTAVEWQHIELSKFLYGKSEFTDANDILIKSKEMEKEQIRMSYEKGLIDGIHGPRKECYNQPYYTNEK